MRFFYFILILLIVILFQYCKETTITPSENENSLKLVLSYENITGDSTYNAMFTGILYGPIDSLRMNVPDVFLFGAGGKTIIRYALPDTFVYAKREYTHKSNLNSGNYTIYMLLQCADSSDIYSDTLHITIQ